MSEKSTCVVQNWKELQLCPLEDTWCLNVISLPTAGGLASQAPSLTWLPFFPDAKKRKQEKVLLL